WGIWAVVLFTLLSAADYFRKFWHTVDAEVKLRRRKELLQLERQNKKAARVARRSARAATRAQAAANRAR
ncbi:MAG: hypothetical protein RL328_1641, partial [Acidobacteriota bacterium]